MLKVLVQKEFKRLISFLSTKKSRKNSQNKVTKVNPIGMIILWAFVFLSIAMAFMGVCAMLGNALIPVGFDWLYYAIVGILGFVLSIVGNGFMASSMLFKAKDNALLLSMPIKPATILASRLVVLAILSVIYAMIPLVPALLIRVSYDDMPVSQWINGIILIILSAVVTTAVSIWLGWIIAFISNHTKHKSLVTVVLSLTFLTVYYYFNFNSQKYLKILVENSMAIGEKMQSLGFLWPIYQFGHAMAGESKALLLFAVFAVAFFAVTYYVVSKSFIKIATTTGKTLNVKYEADKQAKVEMLSSKKTLLKKELKKFLSSPTYMMNSGLGLLFLVAAAIMLFIKKDSIGTVFAALESSGMGTEIIPIICTAVIMLMNSMNLISAPSISLEGKNLWILKSMPIDTGDIFYAKTYLGFYLAIVPTLLFSISMAYVIQLDSSVMVLFVISALIHLLDVSKLGLMLNLKYPKFDWTSEAVPIKQSLPIVILMFGGWAMAAIYFAIYNFIFKNMLNITSYMTIMLVLLALLSKVCDKWLQTKGKSLFESYEA